MEYEWVHELVLDKVGSAKLAGFSLYRSNDAFDGDVVTNSYADINGVYINSAVFEESPPDKIQITLKW